MKYLVRGLFIGVPFLEADLSVGHGARVESGLCDGIEVGSKAFLVAVLGAAGL